MHQDDDEIFNLDLWLHNQEQQALEPEEFDLIGDSILIDRGSDYGE